MPTSSISNSVDWTTITTLGNPISLDIGCGQDKPLGWVGLDIVALPGVDIVHDILEMPWPLADNSVAEARACHVLEHIPMLCMCCRNQVDPLFRFFDEVWRVLIPNGTLQVISPHSSSIRAWQDPTHCRAINEATFAYTSRKWRQDKAMSHYQITCNFSSQWGFTNDEHGVIMDIHAELRKEA